MRKEETEGRRKEGRNKQGWIRKDESREATARKTIREMDNTTERKKTGQQEKRK